MSRGYVIGLGSLPGAGKGALVEQLEARGVRHLHVGTMVRQAAESNGFIPEDETREAYLPFWREHASRHGNDWLARIAFATAKDLKSPVVLDGVRIKADAQAIKDTKNATMVWLDGDLPVLAQRLLDRGRVEDVGIQTVEDHITSLQAQLDGRGEFDLGGVRELADINLFPTVQIEDLEKRQLYNGRIADSLLDLCNLLPPKSY